MEDTYYGGEQSEAMLRPWMEKKRVGGKKEKKGMMELTFGSLSAS